MADDAYLGIPSPEKSTVVSQDHYATKLRKRLQFAYKVASKEAQKAAERNKAFYDLKVREATLDIGDRVLIRQVAFKGRHKISDKWIKDLYIVIGVPIPGIPVFQVQKESDTPAVKMLHRNLLLPFLAIPKISQVEDTFPQKPVRKPRTRQEKAKPEPITNLYDSEHSSESEEEVSVTFPSHKNPKRRISNIPDVSRVSKTRDSSSSYVSQGHP